MIAALVSGTLAISGCTTNPIPVNVKQANPVLAQSIGSLVGAGVGALSSSNMTAAKAR